MNFTDNRLLNYWLPAGAQLFLLLTCLLPTAAAQAVAAQAKNTDRLCWRETTVERYLPQPAADHVVLEMGYAQSAIGNPTAWAPHSHNRRPVEIDLVFTRYPSDKTRWVTPYDSLLNRRIEELCNLMPELATDTVVQWNLVLQTDCKNERQASKMFHGAVVRHVPRNHKRLQKSIDNVRNIVLGQRAFADSVVFRVFNRHPEWDDMLIINDWTASMYAYGAQAMLWHRLNMQRQAVKQFVFFNDGNFKRDSRKGAGQTGGLYTAAANDVRQMIITMQQVMANGNGGDLPENDVEAILHGIRYFPEHRDVILIADNQSAVRDLELARLVGRPVKIILCGVKPEAGIHPDYLELARKTGGSVHTLEQDIYNLAEQVTAEQFDIFGKSYSVKGGRVVEEMATTDF